MLSIDKYWSLISRLDSYSSEWSAAPPFPLSCQPGCDDCCHSRFTLFAVEVAAIGEALGKQGRTGSVTPGGSDSSCPFLAQSRCQIYDVRPIICRTQGYPFIYQDSKGETVSQICTHNRMGTEVSLPAKYVLNLETLNRCLASLNYLYIAEMEERGTVVPARLDILRILEEPADNSKKG